MWDVGSPKAGVSIFFFDMSEVRGGHGQEIMRGSQGDAGSRAAHVSAASVVDDLARRREFESHTPPINPQK